MASRSLTSLQHHIEKLALEWHKMCEDDGIDVLVYCTYRGPAEQAALFAQGRQDIKEVNRLRAEAGITPLGPGENKFIITKAKPFFSWHQFCRAWDAVPLIGGKACWDKSASAWQTMGKRAKDLGIEWGGTWTRFSDYPHFQVCDGKTLAQAQEEDHVFLETLPAATPKERGDSDTNHPD